MAEESSSSSSAGEAIREAALSAENAVEKCTANVAIEVPPAANAAEGAPAANVSAGEKRKLDEGDGEDVVDTPSTSIKEVSTDDAPENKPKKAKISMPPPVSSSLTDVEKYTLECPPPSDNTNEADAKTKITTPNLMLFGLHPLIQELPLQKFLEDYGKVLAITVRSAFASRYGHVTFETVEEARKCYTSINGAKLLHKAFLVQPSMASAAPKASTSMDSKSKESKDTETTEVNTISTDSAGAAAATAAATATATTPT